MLKMFFSHPSSYSGLNGLFVCYKVFCFMSYQKSCPTQALQQLQCLIVAVTKFTIVVLLKAFFRDDCLLSLSCFCCNVQIFKCQPFYTYFTQPHHLWERSCVNNMLTVYNNNGQSRSASHQHQPQRVTTEVTASAVRGGGSSSDLANRDFTRVNREERKTWFNWRELIPPDRHRCCELAETLT